MEINRIVKKDGKITKKKYKIKESPYNVRVEQEVYERLIFEAKKNNKSITKEINDRLKTSLML